MELRELTIEGMTPEDLPEVLAIERQSFPIPFSEKLFRMELNLSVARLFVVRSGGAIAGYIDYWQIGSEIHLITFAVHPEWRRRGVGAVLFERMLEEARKSAVREITLDVRPSNDAALALYRKFGFEQVGIRKAYYQDNQEDALVLLRRMKNTEV